MRKRRTPIIVYLFFLMLILGLVQLDRVNRQAQLRREKLATKPSKKDKQIDAMLRQMTLEEKLGQLFWARVPHDHQIENLQTYHLGGYILFGKVLRVRPWRA